MFTASRSKIYMFIWLILTGGVLLPLFLSWIYVANVDECYLSVLESPGCIHLAGSCCLNVKCEKCGNSTANINDGKCVYDCANFRAIPGDGVNMYVKYAIVTSVLVTIHIFWTGLIYMLDKYRDYEELK